MTRRASGAVIVTALLGLLVVFGGPRAGAQTTTTTTVAQPTTEAPTTASPPTTATTLPVTTPVPTTPVPTTPATTAPATTTSTSTTSTSVPATTAPSSSDTTAIVAAVIGVAAVALAIILTVLLLRRRRRSRWWAKARLVSAEVSALASAVNRGVPLLRDPNAAVQVWADLNGRITHLRSQLRIMGQSTPDARARAATNRATEGVASLQVAIDTDRAVRIGPPPPTTEQLGYSEALLRQRAAELEGIAQDFEVAGATTT